MPPPGPGTRVLLRGAVLASVVLGARYLWWRAGTVHGTGILGAVLFAAEIAGWLQICAMGLLVAAARWRERPTAPAVGSVDVFVTVCGEPVSMVEQTVLAALRMSYPHQTYILNDGRIAGKPGWAQIDELARCLGVPCFTRTSGGRGKAGNLNYALARSTGDYVVTIDADHLAIPELIDDTLGYLADSRVAFVCTYQRFQTTGPDVLNNGEHMFYAIMQPAKDAAGCAISCGNGSVYRRAAVESIGGFSEWNFVEDLHTSYRLHAAGWISAYHPYPVTVGTAPETAAEYMAQRERWAMDSLRLLLRDCPLTRRGLRWSHRLHYFHTTSFYLFSWIQLVFLAVVLAYAFTGRAVINSPGVAGYLTHALPYLFSLLTFLVTAHGGPVRAIRSAAMLQFSAPLFTTACLRVLTGKAPRSGLSRKHRQRRFSRHLLVPALLFGVLILGIIRAIAVSRPGLSPIGLAWLIIFAALMPGPLAAISRQPRAGAAFRAVLRSVIAILAVLAVLVSPRPQPPAAPIAAGDTSVPAPLPGWSAVFTDGFTGPAGSAVDAQWHYDTGPGPRFGTGEIETMTNSAGNVHLDGSGDLDITAVKQDGGWTSGRIQTAARGVAAPPGGELEVIASIRQPDPRDGLGYWPSFWMLGPGRWPQTGEIDIMEDVNGWSELSGTVHCGVDPGGPCNEPTGIGSQLGRCPDCQQGYQSYAMLLDRRNAADESVTFYLNRREYFSITQDQVGRAVWRAAFDHPLSIILDLAVGGDYPDRTCGCATPGSQTASGGTMSVAYVAAYTRLGAR